MERHVKERLVGAAVLVAAAVLLIPEMLSGPTPDKPAEPARAAGETPLRTYTIDLSQSPGQPSVAGDVVVDNRAPPPEIVAETRAAVTSDSAVAAEAAATPASAPETIRGEAEPVVRLATERPAPTSPPTKPAPEVTAPRQPETAAPSVAPGPAPTGQWAVQLGSFASQATAERMAKELRADGYSAFVMPVRTGGTTLYRVRLGPMRERSAAEETLRRVKARVPAATVVAHQR